MQLGLEMTDAVACLLGRFIQLREVAPIAFPGLPNMRKAVFEPLEVNRVRLERQDLLRFEILRRLPNDMTVVHDQERFAVLFDDLAALGEIIEAGLATSAVTDQQAVQHAVEVTRANMDYNPGLGSGKSSWQKHL